MPASAVIATLGHIWSVLSRLQIASAVMGGIAVAYWGRFRATRDVDLLIGVPLASLAPVLDSLASEGIRTRHQPPITTVGTLRLVQLLFEPRNTFVDVQIDLLLAESEYQQTALSRRVLMDLPEIPGPIFTLTCEDLILHKLMAGRILDRSDVAALLRHNRARLERVYMLHWADQMSVTRDLATIWQEAFPGDTLAAWEA